jgi:hypothetical protein
MIARRGTGGAWAFHTIRQSAVRWVGRTEARGRVACWHEVGRPPVASGIYFLMILITVNIAFRSAAAGHVTIVHYFVIFAQAATIQSCGPSGRK